MKNQLTPNLIFMQQIRSHKKGREYRGIEKLLFFDLLKSKRVNISADPLYLLTH